jgi:methionyl-tRNA formyltransferase
MTAANPPLRVLVISFSRQLATALASAARARGHQVVAVLTSPGPPRRRGRGYREVVEEFGEDTDVLVSRRPSLWAGIFAPYDLDLIMCCGFPWKLPAELLELPRLGAINMHPSLLPKYRGAGPNVFGWLLRNDERETGMTVHRMAPEFDTGPILAQERVPIEENDTVLDVVRRLGPLIPEVLDRALAAAEAGDPGTPQEGEGFYCEPFDESWRRVDWTQPAKQVHLQVRGWTGMEDHGHATAELDGAEAIIRRTRLVAATPESDGAAPGTILRRDDEGLLVQCGDGPLLVVDWSPAGPQTAPA